MKLNWKKASELSEEDQKAYLEEKKSIEKWYAEQEKNMGETKNAV